MVDQKSKHLAIRKQREFLNARNALITDSLDQMKLSANHMGQPDRFTLIQLTIKMACET
jgi:hypothetical protein